MMKKKMSSPTKTEMALQAQVSELKGIVIEGFRGINDHLSTLNGQVVDHSKIINKILAKDAQQDGVRQGIKISKDFLITILGLGITFIAAWLYYIK